MGGICPKQALKWVILAKYRGFLHQLANNLLKIAKINSEINKFNFLERKLNSNNQLTIEFILGAGGALIDATLVPIRVTIAPINATQTPIMQGKTAQNKVNQP